MDDRPGEPDVVFDRYDLSALSDDQYELLLLLMRGTDIPFRPTEGDISAPRSRFSEIDAVVEEAIVRSGSFGSSGALGEPDVDDVPVLAGPVRRFVGALIDDVVVALVVLVGFARFDSTVVVVVGWVGVSVVFVIAPTATSGRTVGKAAVGTMVVVPGTFGAPALWRSGLRWFVPIVPWMVSFGLNGLDLGRQADRWIWAITTVAYWLVYLGVVIGPDRRGMHDLVAGTYVVRRPSAVARRATTRYMSSRIAGRYL